MDILTDNVFLEIFHLYLHDPTISLPSQRARNWQTLIHVCRRWRRIIFESPRQLDLSLHCSNKTPVLKNLVFWPITLPLTLNYSFPGNRASPRDKNNIAAALDDSSRVHRIAILGRGPLIKKVATMMRKSFPALTHLDLVHNHDSETFPVIPRRLLGGSAPHLQHLRLKSVSFPRLATFLLSARNLVTLHFMDIPPRGYTSPEAMAGSLAVLTRLTTLSITFHDDFETLDQQGNQTDPPNRVILPALSEFHYKGFSVYLEDFLAQIDAPQLNHVSIGYILYEIQAFQLSRFIERTENFKLDNFTRAKVIFYRDESYFELVCPQEKCSQAHLSLEFSCQEDLYNQVSCMADVLGQLAGQLAMFPNVDDLSTRGDHVTGLESMDLTQWQPFFHCFPAVRALRLLGGVKMSIVSALEETTMETTQEMVTDPVFPALRLIWLVEDGDYVEDEDDDKDEEDDDEDGEDEEDEEDWNPVGSIGRFLSLRHLAGRPVTVVNTEDEFVEAQRSCQLGC
jgi:hypothetical protein